MQAEDVYYLAIYDFHVHTPKEGEVLTLTEDKRKDSAHSSIILRHRWI